MQKLGVWDLIDQTSVSPLKEAKVFDGDSDSLLNFAAKKTSIGALGYLVPNHLIRQALFNKASSSDNLTIINEISVESVKTSVSDAEVTLSNGEVLILNWLWLLIVGSQKLGVRWVFLLQ